MVPREQIDDRDALPMQLLWIPTYSKSQLDLGLSRGLKQCSTISSKISLQKSVLTTQQSSLPY